ncbi:FecR family protein [Mucilaginibacter psychrotolerans]|uniref:FecR family protein n=1 Tax=Mucilaginibacter psychrotolerans TaxID=1524096 RepID=A0A4Y8SFE4_9SPHI|nr:FecR domain-containing protein [Mucilaginibacter psychrotolerans]TFF37759.1 FecR family protein [Mucilaginibacter psychrotolerans]
MTDKEIKELFDRCRSGNASEEDIALLESWYVIRDADEKFYFNESESVHDVNLVWNNIQNNIQNPPVRRLWPRIAAAASILLMITSGAYFMIRKPLSSQITGAVVTDFRPGGNKAVLILDNGQQIQLNNAPNGRLATQGAASVSKDSDGLLAYNAAKTANTIPGLNTLITPRGGQYHVILSDGTQVWLNSASSIKYPTTFEEADRTVDVTGEAYFEVAHNAEKPFKVRSRGQLVTVLGTHFDVNTYADEPATRTTLLEGRVRIEAGLKSITIKPGQQAVYADDKLIVNQADIDDAIAWKNGMFRFNEESLESIMRKISRWYNVNVYYENDEVRGTVYTGIITHFDNVSKVLRMLELTKKVKFKITGDKIIVTKP